jgi:hypothetical protein
MRNRPESRRFRLDGDVFRNIRPMNDMTLDVYSRLTSTIQGQAVTALDEFYEKTAGKEIGGQTADADARQAN